MKMDRETELHILNVLRKGTITWHVRNEALNRNRFRREVGRFKNGKAKLLWYRNCDDCGESHPLSGYDWEVDHIEPVGSFTGDFDVYVRRMYCSPDNLQVLCYSCHQRKTAIDTANIRLTRKKKELTVEDSHDDQFYLDVL